MGSEIYDSSSCSRFSAPSKSPGCGSKKTVPRGWRDFLHRSRAKDPCPIAAKFRPIQTRQAGSLAAFSYRRFYCDCLINWKLLVSRATIPANSFNSINWKGPTSATSREGQDVFGGENE